MKISNIDLPEGVQPSITDRDFVIATLAPPTVEVETKADGTDADTAKTDTESKETVDDKKEESSEDNSK